MSKYRISNNKLSTSRFDKIMIIGFFDKEKHM